MLFDINILVQEEKWLEMTVAGKWVPVGGWWPSCVHILTFLCFGHSSSVLGPVLLKTELVEKGFIL